jgi:DNA-binding transcriptional LysR family regulator
MQGSLPAGWLASTGRELNPLDRCKRFQITFSSPFSGFILAQRKFHGVPPSVVLAAMVAPSTFIRHCRSDLIPTSTACGYATNSVQLYFHKIPLVRMDTRFLESFVTVIESGSIAEAARQLNLTAAAVAKRIRALERDLGTILLFRSGRTVRPTEAGAAILDRARNFLGEARDLKSIASNEQPSGQLRLGAFQSALAGLLPDILVLMTEKYPQIEVHIVRDTSAQLYRRVLDGDIDAAMIAEPPFAIPKVCNWHVLREEPLIVLTRAPAVRRDPHAILRSEPFIRLDRNLWPGRLVDGYLRKAGIRPRERFELDGVEAIAVLVDRGLGVSLVPDWVPPWPEGLSLAKLAVPDPSFARRIGLVWARASLRLRLVHALLEQATFARVHGQNSVPKHIRSKVRRQ